MLGEEEAVSAGSVAQVGGWHGDIPGEPRSASLCQVVSLCCLIWLFSACRVCASLAWEEEDGPSACWGEAQLLFLQEYPKNDIADLCPAYGSRHCVEQLCHLFRMG